MSVELQTGAKCNVTSASDAELYAGIYGSGSYVMGDPPTLALSDANTLEIGPCNIIQNGRHIRLRETSLASIPSGVQGAKRSSLVVVRTTLSYDYETLEPIEKSELLTLTGDASADGDPPDPETVSGDLLAGDTVSDFPIARVVTDGLNVEAPINLTVTARSLAEVDEAKSECGHAHAASDITSGTLSLANGGTGATSAANAVSNMKSALVNLVYPVGAVYISYASTSPASLFGGTWTAITGAFPYFNAGTGTGGSNTHTLTTAQMPQHRHSPALFGYTTDGWIPLQASYGSYGSTTSSLAFGPWFGSGYSAITTYSMTEAAGGSTAHNNMPAYQTLYAWRRTA